MEKWIRINNRGQVKYGHGTSLWCQTDLIWKTGCAYLMLCGPEQIV